MASVGPWLGGGRREWDSWFGSPFSSDIWDPFGVGLGWETSGDDTDALAHANVDWRETDKAHIFRADLLGVRKEEVKVQVEDGNMLQISGERVKEQEDSNDKWHCVERRLGGFLRRFRLPEKTKAEDVKCTLENGVLTVTVPKEENTENVKPIDIVI